MITRSTVRAAASGFWSLAGGRSLYGEPIDLERAVVRSLPVAVHRVAGLSTRGVTGVLERFGIQALEVGPDRDLRGCLVADVGVGLIFVDANDLLDEQRLTVAHEAAHFLLHYMAPRQRALAAFGPNIVPVLERTRSPSPSELFSSALRAVPIRPFRHAMDRDGDLPVGQATVMEIEADELALELLAPCEVVRTMTSDAARVASRFGIPERVAMRLVEQSPSVVTTIGVEGIFGIK